MIVEATLSAGIGAVVAILANLAAPPLGRLISQTRKRRQISVGQQEHHRLLKNKEIHRDQVRFSAIVQVKLLYITGTFALAGITLSNNWVPDFTVRNHTVSPEFVVASLLLSIAFYFTISLHAFLSIFSDFLAWESEAAKRVDRLRSKQPSKVKTSFRGRGQNVQAPDPERGNAEHIAIAPGLAAQNGIGTWKLGTIEHWNPEKQLGFVDEYSEGDSEEPPERFFFKDTNLSGNTAPEANQTALFVPVTRLPNGGQPPAEHRHAYLVCILDQWITGIVKFAPESEKHFFTTISDFSGNSASVLTYAESDSHREKLERGDSVNLKVSSNKIGVLGVNARKSGDEDY